MSKAIDKDQIKTIHTLLSVKNLHEQKRSMVADVSNGRTESTTQLFYDEAEQLINFLNGGKKQQTEEDLRKVKMIKKIIAMAHEIGWIKKKMVVKKCKLQEVNDYQLLNDWLDKFGYLHKKLNAYEYSELPKLLSQFEFGPYKEYMSKL